MRLTFRFGPGWGTPSKSPTRVDTLQRMFKMPPQRINSFLGVPLGGPQSPFGQGAGPT
jgi:hypothetical protein